MQTEIENNILTITLEGRIESNNANQTEMEIMTAVNAVPDAAIVLDAEKLEYISSAGLRVLMKLIKQGKKGLSVVNVSHEVYDIFEITGFTEMLNVKRRPRDISVEGCEMIGSGAFGSVYRIDPETIVKLYAPFVSLEFVERERDISKKAFLIGVPTAIAYDVVKCGDCYGVVYELLNAKTVAQVIAEDPGKIPEVTENCAALLKELHQIVPGRDFGMQNRKEEFLDWVDSLSDCITAEEADKIRDFIRGIPDRDTFLHGDFNFKNIMTRDGEYQLIDIGDAAIGHPVFDLSMMMMVHMRTPGFIQKKHGDAEADRLLGYDHTYAAEVWSRLCSAYFGLSSTEEIQAMTQKLEPYSQLWWTYYHIMRSRNDKEELPKVIDGALRGELLTVIERVPPLDF